VTELAGRVRIRVPADVTAEERLAAGLTAPQWMYLAPGGALGFLAFAAHGRLPLVVLAAAAGAVGLLGAFLRPGERHVHSWVAPAARFLRRRRASSPTEQTPRSAGPAHAAGRRRRSRLRAGRPLAVAVVLLVALLAFAGWLRPVARPVSRPAAPPVPTPTAPTTAQLDQLVEQFLRGLIGP
jgi:hypothetical protein